MKHEIGITTARNGLRLRDSPRDGSTLAVLPMGTQITVKGRETWMRVNVAGQEGYVLADYVEPAPEGSAVIEEFTSGRMRGEVIRISHDFVPAMRRLVKLCETHDVILHITSSLREPYQSITNAVVEPAELSNHFVGHAIDMNIIFNGDWYNSGKLSNFHAFPTGVQQFLDAVESDHELRWGGKFTTPDPVHIDDNLNHRDRHLYVQRLNDLWSGSAALA